MKIKKALVTGTILGLAIFGTIVLRDFYPLSGGVVSAILVGTVIGRLADTNPVRCTINSIFAYNIVVWVIIALFDPDARIVLGFEDKMVAALFVSFIILMIVLYSILGSFSALAMRKASHGISNHMGCER